MSTGRRQALRRYVRFLALQTAIAGGLILLGYRPTRILAGAEATPAMLAGCGLCFVTSVLSALPATLAHGGTPVTTAVLNLVAVPARILMVLAGVVAIGLSAKVDVKVLGVWTALSYLVFLIADVRYALILSR